MILQQATVPSSKGVPPSLVFILKAVLTLSSISIRQFHIPFWWTPFGINRVSVLDILTSSLFFSFSLFSSLWALRVQTDLFLSALEVVYQPFTVKGIDVLHQVPETEKEGGRLKTPKKTPPSQTPLQFPISPRNAAPLLQPPELSARQAHQGLDDLGHDISQLVVFPRNI